MNTFRISGAIAVVAVLLMASQALAQAPTETAKVNKPSAGGLEPHTPFGTRAGFPERFECNGMINRGLSDGYQKNLVEPLTVRYSIGMVTIEGAGQDAWGRNLGATVELIQSYALNGTQYWTATTPPGKTKIHYSFFMFLDQRGRGTMVLKRLGGGGGVSYLDLKCTAAHP